MDKAERPGQPPAAKAAEDAPQGLLGDPAWARAKVQALVRHAALTGAAELRRLAARLAGPGR
jgi:hypothetical protein